MSLSRKCESLSATSVALKQDTATGTLKFDGTGDAVSAPSATNYAWKFRERLWKRLNRTSFDARMDFYRKQELAKKQIFADRDWFDKQKAKTGSYPTS